LARTEDVLNGDNYMSLKYTQRQIIYIEGDVMNFASEVMLVRPNSER